MKNNKDRIIEKYKELYDTLPDEIFSDDKLRKLSYEIASLESESAKKQRIEKEMKIVYIAHPISGDVKGNLEKIKNIIRGINLAFNNILPFAHYFVDCHVLNDNNPEERQRGIKNDIALFKAGFIDELWLFGDRISNGMQAEIELAKSLNIPIISKSDDFEY